MKVNLIGSYPPPYGGIATHIERFHLYLQSRNIKTFIYTFSIKYNHLPQKNIYLVANKRKKALWAFQLFFKSLFYNQTVYHFHSCQFGNILLMGLMGFFKRKVILTIHGDGLYDQLVENKIYKINKIKKFIISKALNQISFYIAVNCKIKGFLKSNGIPPKKIAVIPAFLPPILENENQITLPKKLETFLNNHEIFICLNANKIVFYKNIDLYGIDLSIELCKLFKKKCNNVGFICLIGNIEKERTYFDSLCSKINSYGIDKDYLLLNTQMPFMPILSHSDIYLRPTNTDGDSVSIREAIFLKKIVIASDVINRPSGTILFKNRNINDLLKVTQDVIHNLSKYQKIAKELKSENNSDKILKIYEEMI